MHKHPQTNTIIEHIRAEYDAEPEFLWPERYPILRYTYIGKEIGMSPRSMGMSCFALHSNFWEYMALLEPERLKTMTMEKMKEI